MPHRPARTRPNAAAPSILNLPPGAAAASILNLSPGAAAATSAYPNPQTLASLAPSALCPSSVFRCRSVRPTVDSTSQRQSPLPAVRF
uniref:Uncharacterized protein n=1 Tax=Leersia perrieri TaxID=77586 RepID=A0A0D9XD94_9ORYZ